MNEMSQTLADSMEEQRNTSKAMQDLFAKLVDKM
jgi:hypothetical protein